MYSLFRANLLNHTKPLSISSYLTEEEDYVPMLSAMRKFSKILQILPSTTPAYKYVQVIIISVRFLPVVQRFRLVFSSEISQEIFKNTANSALHNTSLQICIGNNNKCQISASCAAFSVGVQQ